LRFSTSVAGALRVREAVAGVAVMAAGALAVSVTVPLKPLIGASARGLVPDPEGEIGISAFWVVREKSDWAMMTFTAFEAAEL
jgi:hypothetical protein